MPVGPEEYRRALRRFASGVTVVTVANGSEFHGMTASSFAAVSLEPPMVLVSLEKGSRTRALVLEAKTFGVNVLAEDQREVAQGFSQPGHKPFETTAHHAGTTGVPLLDDALAAMECRIYRSIDAGDHDVVIAEVLTTDVRDGFPLVYFKQAYRSLLP